MFFDSRSTLACWLTCALLLLVPLTGHGQVGEQSPDTKNLALASHGAEATALNYGTFSGNRRVARKANDGNPNTAWGGTWTDGRRPNWLRIELAEPTRVGVVTVSLGSHTLVYRLERSLDGRNWTKIEGRIRHEGGTTRTFRFDPARARYVRMVCLGTDAPRSHIWQYIVKELKVFSPPKPPSILSVNATPNPVTAGQTVRFASNVRNADRFRWAFGDGTSASGAAATHVYDAPGQYTAELTARSSGGRDTRRITVRVSRTEDDDPTIADRPRIDTQVPETQMHRPDAVAVVIGNKKYRNSDIPNVKYATRDAQVVKKYLTRALGVREENIIYVENASAAVLTRIFGTADDPQGQLYNWVRPDESEVFVYYSGHGAPSPESGRAYLVPSDANPNYLSQNGYPVEQLYENLATVPAKSVTVALESCFSGVSEGGAIVRQASPVQLSVENPVTALDNGLALTAGAADQIASWYPEKKHGLFTYFFLKGLRGAADQDGDRAVTGAEVGRYVKDKVPYRARRMHNREQTPQVVGQNKDRVLVQYGQTRTPGSQ